MKQIFILTLVCLCKISAQTQQEFLIIAHRGASGYAPENTLAAFRKAIELGANVLETDVRQTKDGHLVLVHDASVDRTTNGEGDVADLTLAELKLLDAGGWFSHAFRDERIPTLVEVIDLLPDSTKLIIEIKGDSASYPGIEERVVNLVAQKRIADRVILKSFDVDVLNKLRRLAPEVPQLLVYAFRIPWIGLVVGAGVSQIDVLSLDVQYLQPHSLFVTESFVRSAHRRNINIIAWDVETGERMKEMIAFGVDGIETDYPDVLRQVLSSTSSAR